MSADAHDRRIVARRNCLTTIGGRGTKRAKAGGGYLTHRKRPSVGSRVRKDQVSREGSRS